MKTLLTIKTDKSIKLLAQSVAEEIGVPLSTVINSFLKQFVRDKEVTFSASYNPSPSLRQTIKEVDEEFRKGKLKSYNGLDALMKELNS